MKGTLSMSTVMQLNYQLFQAINTHAGHSPLLDALMVFCANLLIFFWPLLLLALWGRPLAWRKRSLAPGEVRAIQERRAVVLWIGIACILAYVFNLTLEHFIFEPRPFITHHIHLLVTHPADDSFPSDHSAWSFAVVGMIMFMLPSLFLSTWHKRTEWKWGKDSISLMTPTLLTIAAVIIACSIGVARVFVGIHYPGDIVGGAIDGLIAAGIVTLVRYWLRKPTNAVIHFAQNLHLA